MSDDLKDWLERLGDRVPDQRDAFERLREVRERKQRNQARGALALALTIAVVGSLIAVTAFRGGPDAPVGSDTPSPDGAAGWQPPEVLTVWPETPMSEETPADVQARVDAGDQDLQWRLDPEQVTQRFAQQVLGWESPGVREATLFADWEGPLFLIDPCGPQTACDPAVRAFVYLMQPVTTDAGGIWSVAAVTSERLVITVGGNSLGPMDPAAALAGGSTIEFDVTLDPASATSAHVGFTAANGCSGAGSVTPALPGGHHELTLPEADAATDGCGSLGAGYVFVYVTDDTTIPVGDPLVEPTAIEFPWLTVVPIYLQMEEPDATGTATVSPSPTAAPSATDVLRVCGDDDSPDGIVVVAEAAGVSVHVDRYNTPVTLVIDGEDRIRTIVDYSPVVTLDLEPGLHSVQCTEEGTNVIFDPVRFEVVDPNGYWVDPALDCSEAEGGELNSGPIRVDRMADFASSILTGQLAEQVTIVPGGYPENQDERVFLAVTADGRVAGSATFSRRGGTEWFPDGFSTCTIDAMF